MAPHIIWPMRFVLPHHEACALNGCSGLACLFTTTLVAASYYPRPLALILSRIGGAILQETFDTALNTQTAGWDSRLVILNLRDAWLNGADARTKLISAVFDGRHWRSRIKSAANVSR